MTRVIRRLLLVAMSPYVVNAPGKACLFRVLLCFFSLRSFVKQQGVLTVIGTEYLQIMFPHQ
jgi:hypothetical protein